MVLVAKLLELLGLQGYEVRSSDEVDGRLEEYYIVDVRGSADEQIPGTDETVGMREIGSVSADSDDVLVYCDSGMRSAGAARRLSKRGYDAVSLKGGIKGWKSAGRDLD